jgi:kynureninase
MNFENTLAFAKTLDQQDDLRDLRNEFLFPEQDGKRFKYLCGNSLGLQPIATRKLVEQQMSNWERLAVEGWFEGEAAWLAYHKQLKILMAPIVGAKVSEVCPMNTLTVNLHLLMVSFYRPTAKRFKIIMEESTILLASGMIWRRLRPLVMMLALSLVLILPMLPAMCL